MIKDHWLKSNISQRLTDPSVDFCISIEKTPYTKLSFEDASIDVCYQLASFNKPIYVGLSGGIDSEYVFRMFHKLGIKAIPVIVCTTGNVNETPYAFKICKELNVDPVVIEKTEQEYIELLYHNIFKKINGVGVASVASLIVAEYAAANNGIFVKSDHFIDEKDSIMEVGANEWDFYNDVLINTDNTCIFFMYTPEIVYSMVSRMHGQDAQRFKCELYNIPFREKIKFESYSETFAGIIRLLRTARKSNPSFYHSFGTSHEFLQKYF